MKKSVYSLVLMDDVIRAVDREAYRRGTSRSNLINQILAQQLSCETPEMRMQDIFGSLSDLIDHCFSIQQQRSSSLMTLRTALEYKYRPTINYKVELDRIPGDYIGTLKVQIRTQNLSLMDKFCTYFIFRSKLEASALSARGFSQYAYSINNGIFTRKLLNTALDPEQTGNAISQYLNELNHSIQTYFSLPDEVALSACTKQLSADYIHMLDRYIL
jgi:hypothetical protein